MIVEDEKSLIAACISGKREYQEFLYQKYCRKMFGLCLRYTQSKEDAEDLLQESFIKVFRNLKNFNASGSLEGWIRKIVVNTILESFRKKKIKFGINDEVEEVLHDNTDVLSELSAKELLVMIRVLAPAYRAVFNLFAIEGYSHKEIAGMLNISEGTSKSHYFMARQKLMFQINKLQPDLH